MSHINLPWFEFAPGTFEIDEFDCASIFLFVGKERALLLDTGVGIGNIRELVENLTDRPYDVVLTHGHLDHCGGAGWFEKVYINQKDCTVDLYPPSLESRREYAKMITEREHKYYPYDINADIVKWKQVPLIIPLFDGQTFDLGGRSITFYECAGHTPGEMVAIDHQNKILFCGDACNNFLIFQSDPTDRNFISVEEAGRNLARIWKMRDQYDAVINSHHDYRVVGGPFSPSVLPNAIQCCQNLVEGCATIIQIENPLKTSENPRMISVASLDNKSWIWFNPNGIHELRA